MNRLYTVPDKCKISVRIKKDYLSRFTNPENCFLAQQYEGIKKFLRNRFEAGFNRKSGISFECQGSFIDYYPKYWQMDFSVNPLKNAAVIKCEAKERPLPMGLDRNSNFLPIKLFDDCSPDSLEELE